MKNIFTPLLGVLVCAALPLLADENSEHKLADAAFAAGDYKNAVSGYRNAMHLADSENNPEAWAQNALRLADASLRSGDLNGAQAVYSEFRRRNPLRSAGTLPGDLLAANGKFVEAERFFTALIKSNPELADAATFGLGMARLRSGNIEGAYEIFSKLAQGDSLWAVHGKYEAVYALIHLGRSSDALAGLGNIPPEKRNLNWEMLHFLADAYAGKIENLKKNFSSFIEKQPPQPHIRLMELLSAAANAAVRQKECDFALQCLHTALDLAADETVKREIFRRIINVCFITDPVAGAKKALLYAESFPGAADRGIVLNSAGRMLVQKNMYDDAVKIFETLCRSTSYNLNDRLDAAAEIVVIFDKGKKKINPEPYYLLLSEKSQNSEKKSFWMTQFAVYLEKNGFLKRAETEFEKALQNAPEAKKEKSHFELMNFFIRSGNDAGILREANFLSGVQNNEYQTAAKFELGKLAEKNNNFAEAGKFFREAGNSAAGNLRSEALFQAALMSYKQEKFAAAGNEFMTFAAENHGEKLTSNALYHAAIAFKYAGNEAREKEALNQLKERFPESEAFAYAVLASASERGNNGDISGAIAELETLEDNFNNTAAGNEALMLKAVFMDKRGSSDEALKELMSVVSTKKPAAIAAESALYAGEILYRRNQFDQAKKMFIHSAELYKDDLLADIASGRAIDCDLAQSTTPDPGRFNETVSRCERLAASTKFPQIRIQALYKLGLCRENAGNPDGAVSAYEKLIYAANELALHGVKPDPQWCIRAVESALDILCRYQLPGALQRGLRIIKKFEALKLPENTGNDLRRHFRNQLKNTRRK